FELHERVQAGHREGATLVLHALASCDQLVDCSAHCHQPFFVRCHQISTPLLRTPRAGAAGGGLLSSGLRYRTFSTCAKNTCRASASSQSLVPDFTQCTLPEGKRMRCSATSWRQ